MDIKNLAIVRQSFANTVFTHKVQEVACETAIKKSNCIKYINLILVGLILLVIVFQLINQNSILYSNIGLGLSIGEILFLIIQLSFNFSNLSILHKSSAYKYMGLRDNYKNFISDIMNETIDANYIRNKRDELQREYQIISELAPQTTNANYKTAQNRLNKKGGVEGEDFTWSDQEINRFLPKELNI